MPILKRGDPFKGRPFFQISFGFRLSVKMRKIVLIPFILLGFLFMAASPTGPIPCFAGDDNNPDQGLILWYDFTRAPEGFNVDDLSGSGYTGQLMGPLWTGDTGLYFDGEDDFIRVKGGETLHSDTAITVMGEILPASFAKKTWQNIVWKGDQPTYAIKSDNREFSVWLHNNASLHTTATPDDRIGIGHIYINTRTESVTKKRVFAFVVNCTEGTLKTFLDGEIAASGKFSTDGIRRTRDGLRIGGGTPDVSDAFFHGYIRWLRIYNRALSAEEIRDTGNRLSRTSPSPWRDPYGLSDVVVPGGDAGVIPLHDHAAYNRNPGTLASGVNTQNGWLTVPGQHQPTEIIYRHDGSPLRFSGRAAIVDCLDYCGENGLVEMMLFGDGRRLWDSGPIRHKQPARPFSVDLTGIREIRLVTTSGGDDVGEDWAAWLNLSLQAGDDENSVPAAVPIGPESAEKTPATGRMTGTPPEQKGRIGQIYTLTERPSGPDVPAVRNFSIFTDQIYVLFTFFDMTPGTIITGVFLDEGRRSILREFPVVITQKSGQAGFVIHRPIDGWPPGRYRIDCRSGADTMGSVSFNIERQFTR